MDERKLFEIRFPVVEGYAFAMKRNLIRADIGRMEPLILEPGDTPTAVFVNPQVGYKVGYPGAVNGFDFSEQDRQAYYHSNHLQTIKFEIARQVVWALTSDTGSADAKATLRSRHQIFPQVFNIVDEYVNRKVNFHGCHECELGLETYVKRIVERLIAAIEPDEVEGEPPLLPILNRYKPIGSTREVNFKTTRPCFPTTRSHINQVVADTARWEQSVAFRLEQAKVIYARNDHMEFVIPYEYLGVSHSYVPDFLVRLGPTLILVLEIKGHEDEQDRAKHQSAKRWISAVNNWDQLGQWIFHVCKDPQMLGRELEWLKKQNDKAFHSKGDAAPNIKIP